MKKLHFALRAIGFAGIAFFMSSASCELFENAQDLKFDVELEHTFPINEELDLEGGKDYVSEPKDEVLDAVKVNKDFAEHADLIEDIEINSVTYTLSGYASKYPGIVFSNGTLTFSNPDASGTTGQIIAPYNPPSDLESLSTSGDEIELPVDQASADAIATMLKEYKKVRIHAAGHLSSVPLVLNVKMKLKATLTARIL